MGQRPKHQDKDIEAILAKVEAQGWKVSRKTRYYRAVCPCGRHAKWSIHLTPSGANYARNLAAWFERQDCWQEGGSG